MPRTRLPGKSRHAGTKPGQVPLAGTVNRLSDARGARRSILHRLRRHGDFSGMSDQDVARVCEQYVQARIKRWAQEAA